jgi:hypothetical protein
MPSSGRPLTRITRAVLFIVAALLIAYVIEWVLVRGGWMR